MSKIGNYRPCNPKMIGSECKKGLKCKKLSLGEKMTMSKEDLKTGYVCKPSNKYVKVHSRIQREREREREEDEKRLIDNVEPLQQVIENNPQKFTVKRSFSPFRRLTTRAVSRGGTRKRRKGRNNKTKKNKKKRRQ